MALSKEVIWEQVFSDDAELRIQQAFEMLLGEEFGLANSGQLSTAIDQCFLKDYNQGNEKSTINVKGNRHPVKSIGKVDS
jgi:hypothetical protein